MRWISVVVSSDLLVLKSRVCLLEKWQNHAMHSMLWVIQVQPWHLSRVIFLVFFFRYCWWLESESKLKRSADTVSDFVFAFTFVCRVLFGRIGANSRNIITARWVRCCSCEDTTSQVFQGMFVQIIWQWIIFKMGERLERTMFKHNLDAQCSVCARALAFTVNFPRGMT